ncbi:MAG: LuxR C-terminal-related transcriptional regulator [Acidimicrobiia bacterium]|nr:LuxR C-terminal-related transcriptional regulator [Acidimicrobiia bacterium]
MEIGLFASVPRVQKQLRSLLSGASYGKPAEASRWLLNGSDRVAVVALDSASDLDLVVDLRQGSPNAHLVVLLPNADGDAQLKAVRAGASGIGSWRVGREELLGLVRAASESRVIIPGPAVQLLVNSEYPDQAIDLSSEDIACLRMFAAGMPMWRIAELLGVTEPVAHESALSLFRRMGAQSRLQALVMAERLGFLDP